MATNWTLQQTADIAFTNWVDSAGIAGNDGTNRTVSLNVLPGQHFFRLQHP